MVCGLNSLQCHWQRGKRTVSDEEWRIGSPNTIPAGNPNSGRLIGLAPMLPTKHDTPVSFVIDETGTQQAFDVYAVRDVSWWPLLNVGASLSIEDPALELTITATVIDCLLSAGQSILMDRGQTRVIGALDLRSPTLAIPDDQLLYRITALPIRGTLTLSNTAGCPFAVTEV